MGQIAALLVLVLAAISQAAAQNDGPYIDTTKLTGEEQNALFQASIGNPYYKKYLTGPSPPPPGPNNAYQAWLNSLHPPPNPSLPKPTPPQGAMPPPPPALPPPMPISPPPEPVLPPPPIPASPPPMPASMPTSAPPPPPPQVAQPPLPLLPPVAPALAFPPAAPSGQAPVPANQSGGPCDGWQKPYVALPTPWADQIDWTNIRGDQYPRPTMVRDEMSWMSLNGLWEFQVGNVDAQQPPFGLSLLQCIAVPFPMESDLSGIGQHYNYSWYRRTFTLPTTWTKDLNKFILQSTRVDWESTYYLNGQILGTHQGGYDAHAFDATDAVAEGTNELIILVSDLTEAGPNQPLGKQRSFNKGTDKIVYTSVTGIWGSIWLEAVPAVNYITQALVFPDLDSRTVSFTISTSEAQQVNQTYFQLSLNGSPVGNSTNVTFQPNGENSVNFTVDAGENILPWSAESPNMYSALVSISGWDQVQIPFGFHKIAKENSSANIVHMRFNNGQAGVFLSGPLYQGYFSDGLYTPATSGMTEDLVKMIKAIGWNAVRIHGKVEDPLFYHYANVLGLYIFQDIPSPCGIDPTGTYQGHVTSLTYFSCWRPENNANWNSLTKEQFRTEAAAIVEQTRANPSVVAYVAYNEGWGELPEEAPAVIQLISSLAPDKLVDSASGWIWHDLGDFADIHQYMSSDDFAKSADPTSLDNAWGYGKPDPAVRQQGDPLGQVPLQIVGRIPLMGEFGGVGRLIPGHTYANLTADQVCVYNCDVTIDPEELTSRIIAQYEVIATRAGQAKTGGAIYTQLNDIENEVNGVYSYDFQVLKLASQGDLQAAQQQASSQFALAVQFSD